MTIGTDISEFQKLTMSTESPALWIPINPGDPLYTPVEELPADIAILYEYNPVLAKQLLAEAGYPEGLETTFLIDVAKPYARDEAALLQNQWAKIGVELEIEVLDPVSFEMHFRQATYPNVVLIGNDLANPIMTLLNYGMTGGHFAYTHWENEAFNELCTQMQAKMTEAEQMPLAKEANLIEMNEVSHIPCFLNPTRIYWWPWLKNYHGELTVYDNYLAGMYRFIWIDQDLKAEMGY
ncbi:hypothetical protein ES703_66435 [subsurface metagenome]